MLLFEVERGAGAGTAEGEELLHAGLADADEGELGGHEETVGQDEEGHHDYAEKHPFQHSVTRIAFGRLSCRTGALRGRRSLRDACWASRGAPDGRIWSSCRPTGGLREAVKACKRLRVVLPMVANRKTPG